MTLSVITSSQTTNYENIKGMMAPTPNGTKQIQINNGNVELIKKGKMTFILQRKDRSEPEKIDLFVEDGIIYVEHSVINFVEAAAA